MKKKKWKKINGQQQQNSQLIQSIKCEKKYTERKIRAN